MKTTVTASECKATGSSAAMATVEQRADGAQAVAETRQTLVELVNTTGIHAEPADDAGGVRLFTSQDATGYARRAAFALADYGVDASCGPFLHMTPKAATPGGGVAGCQMRRRGADGFPVGADDVLREACGNIPAAVDGKFQGGANHYGHEVPIAVHGWAWSDTFRRWGALVTFANGWHGFTWPKTWADEAGA